MLYLIYFKFRSWRIILEKIKNTCQYPTQKFTGPETGSPPHQIRQSVDLMVPNVHQKVRIEMSFFFQTQRRPNYAVQNSCNLYSFIFYFDILYYRTVPGIRNCDHRPWFSPCYRGDCGLLYIQVRLQERGCFRRCFKARLII